MPGLNFFETYTLMALIEEVVPVTSFFRDRYFPTGEDDFFKSNKILVEYQKGDRAMAPFVSSRVGTIPADRAGHEVFEKEPARVAVSRFLTMDDLEKRGFGEALFSNTTAAQRAAKLQIKDLKDMDARITRREEWMCAQTMINNSCTMQEYVDGKTKGDVKYVKFFDGVSDHTYTVPNKWNSSTGKRIADVKNMCRMLSGNGLPAADLVLGTDVADDFLEDEQIQRYLDKNSGIIIGTIDQQLSKYDGVVYMGTLNFGGFKLNLISCDETYMDENNQTQRYFPTTSAMVTAPNCGHLMYGSITQIDYGNQDPTTHTEARIPKFVVDQPNDQRYTQLACRPLAAPRNYCPYIYAANVVG